MAGRRPDLLSGTLNSFWSNMLRHFSVSVAMINIDPIFGGGEDHKECVRIFSSYFPDGEIIAPETASFGAAVKELWGAAPPGLVLHIEDDWLLRYPIKPQLVQESFNRYGANFRCLFLSSQTTAMPGETLRWRPSSRTARLLQRLRGIRPFTAFGTSPQISDGHTLRLIASMLNPALDPEKQIRQNHNLDLWEFQQKFLSGNLWGPTGDYLVSDTGRAWREERGIRKTVQGARSSWD